MVMQMVSLLQLQYFRALAGTEHITKAAQQLYISPSTLTCMVKKLEKTLGVALFDRRGRNIELNEFGRLYLEHVDRIFHELEEAQSALDRRRGLDKHVLSISVVSAVLWGETISEYLKEYPECQVVLQEVPVDQIRAKLLSHELDVAIAGCNDLQPEGLEQRVISEEAIMLAVPDNHPLATRKTLRMEELSGLPFISISRNHPFQRYLDMVFSAAGMQYNTVLECDYTMRAHMLHQNLGVVLTSEKTVGNSFWGDHVRFIPVTDFPTRKIAVFWSGKNKNPTVPRFCDYLTRQTGQLS